MFKIDLDTKQPYTVVIDDKLLETVGSLISPDYDYSRVAILTDEESAKVYLNPLINSLENSGFNPLIHILPLKNLKTQIPDCEGVIKFFKTHSLKRSDLIFALGGCEVIQIVGFCSSIYNNGIDYISLPTTLLAMIDTAIGGVNKINTYFGHNNIGTTYAPRFVFCDVSTILSKPISENKDGIAQVIKYGAIFDKGLVNKRLDFLNANSLASIIARAIKIKSSFFYSVICSKRQVTELDFGDIYANIIRSHSNYETPYGDALTAGMAMTLKLSEKYGFSKKGTYRAFIECLSFYEFDANYNIPIEYILKCATEDRHLQRNKLSLVLLRELGKPLFHSVNIKNISAFFSGSYRK